MQKYTCPTVTCADPDLRVRAGVWNPLENHKGVGPWYCNQSELPRPIPRNSVESDQGCTSRIYFDNAGDNMTLTSYN